MVDSLSVRIEDDKTYGRSILVFVQGAYIGKLNPKYLGDALEDVIVERINAPRRMDTLGLDTGLVDCNGAPIHLGDTLEFNALEWGDDQTNKFVIHFRDGELVCHGDPSTFDEWCTIIKKWNA